MPAARTSSPAEIAGLIIAAARNGIAGTGSTQEVSIDAAALDGAGPPAGLVNGHFAVTDSGSPDFGWHTFGSASVVEGEGVLSEDSSIAPRLVQTFTVPVGTRFLTFTLKNVALDAPGNGPRDAFEVALLDAATMDSALSGIGLNVTDSLLNVQADGTVRAAPEVLIRGLENDKLPPSRGPVTVLVERNNSSYRIGDNGKEEQRCYL